MQEHKANDQQAAGKDTGILPLAVQKSTGAAVASEGTYSPLQVDSSGNLRVNVAAGGAGDGAILDGVSSSIKATVMDYANSNPLTVRLTDTNGDYVAAGGGGTQYKMDTTTASATGTLELGYDGSIIRAILTDSTGRQMMDVSRVGGQTVATAGTGIQSVGINTAQNAINVSQWGGNTAATAAAGTPLVGVTGTPSFNIAQVGGNTAVTGAAGVLSIDNRLLAGQAMATGGTGIQQVAGNINQVGGQTVATAGTGRALVGVDIFQVGGSTTVTASAGIQRVHSLAAFDVATIYSSGLAKKPTFLQISASASGSNLLVASAASTSYVVLAYNFMSNGAVNAQFLSSATPMGGIAYMPTAGVGKVAPFSEVGWMQTTAGHSLNLNLSANIAVGGELVYIAI